MRSSVKTSFFYVITALLVLSQVSQAVIEFRVIPQRFEPNEIRLQCRSLNTSLLIPNPRFWLNSVDRGNEIGSLGIPVHVSADARTVSFLITQDYEGTYFCGQDLENFSSLENSVVLIAYPNPSRELRPHTFYAKVGTTAHLNCSVRPGTLLSRYSADWANASMTTSFLASIIGPRPLFNRNTNPRYSVNPNTFSLSINAVRLSDSGNYRCMVNVFEPRGERVSYDQTQNLDLTLIVYKAPIITSMTSDQVIPLIKKEDSDQQATFRCQARGEPAPQISWFHITKDEIFDVSEDDENKYSVSTTSEETDDDSVIVTSELRINDLGVFDSGNVRCMALNMPETGRRDSLVPTDSTTSKLTVLGGFDNVGVLITTKQDIIFKISLPVPILVPVQLNIRFIDMDNSNNNFDTITRESYNNSNLITHFQSSAMMPDLKRFRVLIALHHRDREGPFDGNSVTYDLSQANFLTAVEAAKVNKTKIIALTVSITSLFLVIGVCLPILITILCRTRIRRIRNQQKVDLDRISEEHKAALQKLKEVNETKSEKLQEENRHVLQLQALNIFSKLDGAESSITMNNDSIHIQFKHASRNAQGGSMDEIDGELAVTRQSKQAKMFHRVRSVDEPFTEDSIDEKEADDLLSVQCVKCLVEATVADPVLGRELRPFISGIAHSMR